MAAAARFAAISSRRSTYQPLVDLTPHSSSYHPRVEFSPRSSIDIGRIGVRRTTIEEAESHDHARLAAVFLAADRTHSLSPAAGDSSSSSDEQDCKRAAPSRLRRAVARLRGKSARKQAAKEEAERHAAAKQEYGAHYENCLDVSPEDSHSMRSANFHHENFGDLEAYAEGHERRVDLCAAEVVTAEEKVMDWLIGMDKFGVWEMEDANHVILDNPEPVPAPEHGVRRYGNISLYEGC